MSEVLAVLQEALTIEQEGEAFYREAAVTCGSPLAKHTFLYLAEQEAKHAEYFRLVYDALAQQQAWPARDAVDLSLLPVPEAAQGIFARAQTEVETGGPLCVELHEMYEVALEKERHSLALYQQQAAETERADQREFFEFLVAQERGHLELLANTQKFLDDPAHWYFDQEQWIVEG